jgi:hypothetical protein
MQDYTPFIVDDSFDPSSFVGEHFGDQVHLGLLAKAGPLLPMSGYEKLPQREMIEYTPSSDLHDHNAYFAYEESPYSSQIFYSHGLPSQDADFQYLPEDQLKQHPHTAPSSRRTSTIIDHEGNMVPGLVSDNPRKRKASEDFHYDTAPVQKRPVTVQLQVQNANSGYYDVSGQTSPYSPFVTTPASTASHQPSQPFVACSRPMGHHYSTSTASQVSLAAPSPHTPSWSPSFATVKTEPSPPAPMTPVPRPATSSPIKSSAPRLVRTSTIQQPSPTVHGVIAPMQTTSFNPYAMYPLKANLKLRGDLDSMTKDWSTEEIDARRRLVEFKRSQDGSTINADFKPVAPQDRAPSSITISCILWKEKKEYYVTSVDTIYLLEALVGVRFTVEEKNRIRRNLEGFRPATVSKSKADSEDFFKVIMGFPHPKPRNIEKDVKVFPWKILAHALKKIISKYSASYSSTASALLTPVPSSYASTEHSAEFSYAPSPRPEFTNAVVPYVMSHGIGVPGSQIPGRMSAPVTTAPIPELQLQVPTCGPGYDLSDPYGFATMPGMPQASMLMTPDTMSAPVRTGPYEFSNFVNESPVTPAPHSAPPMAYYRGPIETADFVTPANYQPR